VLRGGPHPQARPCTRPAPAGCLPPQAWHVLHVQAGRHARATWSWPCHPAALTRRQRAGDPAGDGRVRRARPAAAAPARRDAHDDRRVPGALATARRTAHQCRGGRSAGSPAMRQCMQCMLWLAGQQLSAAITSPPPRPAVPSQQLATCSAVRKSKCMQGVLKRVCWSGRHTGGYFIG